MIFKSNSDLLEEVKEALVRCDVVGGLQERGLLVLREGGDAPVECGQQCLISSLHWINIEYTCSVMVWFFTHGPRRSPWPRRHSPRVPRTGGRLQQGPSWGRFTERRSKICFLFQPGNVGHDDIFVGFIVLVHPPNGLEHARIIWSDYQWQAESSMI